MVEERLRAFGADWRGKRGPKALSEAYRDLKLVPDLIKAARVLARLEQRDLAKLVGVSTKSISQYETGAFACKGETARRVILACVTRGVYIHCTQSEDVYKAAKITAPNCEGEGLVFGRAVKTAVPLAK